MLKVKYRYQNQSTFVESTDGNITLPNAFNTVLEIQIWVSYDSEETTNKAWQLNNGLDIAGNDQQWTDTKRNYFTSNELKDPNTDRPTFIVYIKDNDTQYERNQFYVITNNENGDFGIVTITQPPCNFQISTDIGTEISIDCNVEKIFTVKVYGKSKNFNIFANAIRTSDNMLLELDELKISKKLIEKTDRYNIYEVSLLFYGSVYFENPNDVYYYNLNLVHADYVDEVTTIIVTPIFAISPEVMVLRSMFDEEMYLQIDNCMTKKDKNDYNLSNVTNNDTTNQTQSLMTIDMLEKMAVKKMNIDLFKTGHKSALNVVSIKDDTIILKTLNYNNETNSAIITKCSAIWCGTKLSFVNNEHIIKVICRPNKDGTERRSSLIIKNAEMMNFGMLKFIVIQDANNKISIIQDN